jgi:hypothetical protein
MFARLPKENRMTATAPDYDDIVRVVQLYVDGFNDGDVSKFKEAFHEDAWMFYTTRDGNLRKTLLDDDVFAHFAAEGSKVDGRIISVLQAGDIANVLLGWDDVADPPDPRDNSWVDFHTLLRINGVWKIMNKTATHHSRAAAWRGLPTATAPTAAALAQATTAWPRGFTSQGRKTVVRHGTTLRDRGTLPVVRPAVLS